MDEKLAFMVSGDIPRNRIEVRSTGGRVVAADVESVYGKG